MTVRVLLEPPKARSQSPDRLRWFRRLLLLIAVVSLGYTGYVYIDSAIYQARENEILDNPQVADAGSTEPGGQPASGIRLAPQTRIGRIEIPRLNVKAVVQEGVDSKTLRRAVGHVPGTALPGETGNVALAAHRDTFFRGLRDVKKEDRITVATPDREIEYVVDSLEIVTPKEVRVRAPTATPVLTLVTCYPFNFIGKAPKRLIVRARQVSINSREFPGS